MVTLSSWCAFVQVPIGDGRPVESRVFTAGYQHPSEVGSVTATSDYYALGKTLEELAEVLSLLVVALAHHDDCLTTSHLQSGAGFASAVTVSLLVVTMTRL